MMRSYEWKTIYSEADIRFNRKKDIAYATQMGVPQQADSIQNPGKKKSGSTVKNVELLGTGERIVWKQNNDSLTIEQRKTNPNEIALVFEVQLAKVKRDLSLQVQQHL